MDSKEYKFLPSNIIGLFIKECIKLKSGFRKADHSVAINNASTSLKASKPF
jgi:hypothetical protein